MRPKPVATDREGHIGNDAAFSMNVVEARAVVGGASINGTGSTRLKLARQSAASSAWLGELQSRRFPPGTGVSFVVLFQAHPISSDGPTMTAPTDTGKNPVVTSRRRLLREGAGSTRAGFGDQDNGRTREREVASPVRRHLL
jgi:hypothetical protein